MILFALKPRLNVSDYSKLPTNKPICSALSQTHEFCQRVHLSDKGDFKAINSELGIFQQDDTTLDSMSPVFAISQKLIVQAIGERVPICGALWTMSTQISQNSTPNTAVASRLAG